MHQEKPDDNSLRFYSSTLQQVCKVVSNLFTLFSQILIEVIPNINIKITKVAVKGSIIPYFFIYVDLRPVDIGTNVI